ncbi:sigma 54-interacting transcriptional regulator [Puniceicoccus vermicola]
MIDSKQCQNKDCTIAREGPSLEMLNRSTGINCRSVQELGLLFAVSRSLENSFDLTDVARPVLRRLQDWMGLERGTVAILNRDTGGLLVSEAIGLPRDLAANEYFKLIEPHLEHVVRKKDAIIVHDLDRWSRESDIPSETIEKLQLRPQTGLICIPLKFADEIIGTLSIERRRNPQTGWEADLRLLSMLASIIAQATKVRQEAAEQIQSLREENDRLHQKIGSGNRPQDMIGSASSMRAVYLQIDQVAPSLTTTLIRGESGTGKELVAKAVHERSKRASKPFVKFNCAALPDSIIESELFGHEKGAFTGALATRKGRFEMAHGGTIFLDEIGDISIATQVKLLRVLQEKEFERVGSQEPRRADVRVIAATSRDLETMMAEGTFREDLYYRLNVFPIYVPPLRERKCDILLLCDFFVEKYADRIGVKAPRISSAAIDLLASYHWPGNVRELENCMERAVIIAKGESIKAHHLPPTLQKKSPREGAVSDTLEDALESLEREMLVDALKETGSNMAEAARRLGMTERKMGLRVKKYGIDRERYK